ncbi:DEAD/DEAH box helicase family protein [Belliella sp. DSM 111904]|uniref:DEAD/DEAH box helicase family protein n=1 Tax=Belliella filtrata TaxID=2923435 RepID=A0ABS9V586_9BACT|nr:DEAD/DEAH box helicase family protein [Belliella filtrata]MCH7411143.1 DEAD/DEAH box helicase family protein [Belliella filtrata]
MKTKFINAVDSDNNPCQYISQIANFKIEDLDNTSLNKVTTGSGFTSYILESDLPYVICVPFKSLIDNKIQWCNQKGIESLAVYGIDAGGATDKEIFDFKGKKIFVTWESLKRLVNALGDKVKDYRIAIDEAHKLTDSGAFRTDAIQDVIELHTRFKAFVLGTATPIEDDYMHSEFLGIQKVHIKWYNLRQVNIKYSVYEQSNLHKRAAMIAINHLTGVTDGNAHIFLNSVKGIAKIIKQIAGSPFFDKSQIRIVASKSERNKEIYRRLKLPNIEVNSINDDVKKVNFYTATAWEGCDVIDNDDLGKTYIISDGELDHTKVNVSVQLPQIIGRVRTSKFKHDIELLYSPNKYNSSVTKEEFEAEIIKEFKETKEKIENYKLKVQKVKEIGFDTDDITKVFKESAESNPFILERNNDFIVNELAFKNEMHNFETIHKVYYVPTVVQDLNGVKKVSKQCAKGADRQIKHNDITYKYVAEESKTITGLDKKLITGRVLFSDLCKEYIELIQEPFSISNRIKIIEGIEPIIKEAFDKLGVDKMKALEYRKGEFQKELIKTDRLNDNSWKVSKLLDLRVGQWVATASLKIKLQEVYDELKIKKKAKATDISNYYNVLSHKKRIDSVPVAGFTIVLEKY